MNNEPKGEILLAYDMKLKRPGCVLLQATLGGSSQAAQIFNHHDWLLSPTPDLKLYSLPVNRLKEVVEITKANRLAAIEVLTEK